MPTHHSIKMRSGGRLQAGIPKEVAEPPGPYHGLVRGVVVATYCVDDPQHPLKRSGVTPTAVYVDLLIYSSASGGSRFFLLPGAVVAQPLGGLHGGAVFKPRATTRLLSGKPLSDVSPQDVGDMDGDHVVVALADGRTNQAVVIASLPHPSRDAGNSPALPVGQRQQLRMTDGDPMLLKHCGSVFGLSLTGDFVVDTTRAGSDTLLPGGGEAPGTPGTGCFTTNIPTTASRTTQLQDATVPGANQTTLRERLDATGYKLDTMALPLSYELACSAGNGWKVNGAGPAARAQLGDGAMHVALAEQMQVWWAGVQAWMSLHTHPQSGPVPGNTGQPLIPAPGYSPAITSGSLSVPAAGPV